MTTSYVYRTFRDSHATRRITYQSSNMNFMDWLSYPGEVDYLGGHGLRARNMRHGGLLLLMYRGQPAGDECRERPSASGGPKSGLAKGLQASSASLPALSPRLACWDADPMRSESAAAEALPETACSTRRAAHPSRCCCFCRCERCCLMWTGANLLWALQIGIQIGAGSVIG